MANDHSNRWHVKLITSVATVICWLGVLLLFIVSLWSINGEYLVSALAFIFMLFAGIDSYRKLGLTQMLFPGPLGRNYSVFRVATLIISAIVNLVVYLKLFLN